MKKIYSFFAVIAFFCISFVSNAQNDGVTFTLLPQMPFTNYLNPGIRMPYKGVFGVGVSNVNYSIFNSSVRYDNIYGKNAQGDDIIDGVKLVNSLDAKDNFINGNLSLDMLNVGFRVNRLFFDINWRMKVNTELRFSRDFLGFFVFGNGHYLGEDNPCNFNIGVDASVYSEIGLGVQYDVNNHLTVGVRPKLLMGVLNASINNDNTKIYTDADSYAISADFGLDIKAASSLAKDINCIGDLADFITFDSIGIGDLFNFKNSCGLGVDFGASYVFNRHFGVAAGVYDLGFITWKNTKEKKRISESVGISNAVFDDFEDVANMKLDYKTMLDNVIDEIWGNDSLVDGADYKTYLKTKIMLQGYYELSPMLRLTAIGQMYYVKEQMRPALTLAYSGAFLNCLNLTLSYTASKYAGNTIGAGIGLHLGPVNLYAVTDNLMVLTKIGKPIVEMSTSYNSMNFRVGLVFTFGKYQRTDVNSVVLKDGDSD